VLNNPPRFTDPLGLWCVWQDGTHDDAENNGGVGPTAWLNDGGLWDDTNSLTGLRLKLELHGQECYRSKAALTAKKVVYGNPLTLLRLTVMTPTRKTPI